MCFRGVGQSVVNFFTEIPYNVMRAFEEIKFWTLDNESKQAISSKAQHILYNMRTGTETKKGIEKAVKHAIVDVVQIKKIQEIRKNNLEPKKKKLINILQDGLAEADAFSKVLMAKIPPRIQAAITDFNELNTPIFLNESIDFQNKLNDFRDLVENEMNDEYKQDREYLKDPVIQEIAQNYAAQLQGAKTRQELLDLCTNLRKDLIQGLEQSKRKAVGADELTSALLACVLAMNNSKVKRAVESLNILFETNNCLVDSCINYVSSHRRLSDIIEIIKAGPRANLDLPATLKG